MARVAAPSAAVPVGLHGDADATGGGEVVKWPCAPSLPWMATRAVSCNDGVPCAPLGHDVGIGFILP